eukprot:Lithocolla_globosa_v1_NODE_3291_length_1710_cov_4.891239.p4 type:complete len:120 gc:universal NODE_3291_length_1710_cov_4.891239:97-456(+)
MTLKFHSLVIQMKLSFSFECQLLFSSSSFFWSSIFSQFFQRLLTTHSRQEALPACNVFQFFQFSLAPFFPSNLVLLSRSRFAQSICCVPQIGHHFPQSPKLAGFHPPRDRKLCTPRKEG